MKMWSGRFRQPLDADFERWQRSFDFDRRLLREELAASHAHAAALKNAGVLTSSELITILQGLKEIGEKAPTCSASCLPQGEPSARVMTADYKCVGCQESRLTRRCVSRLR